jgi:flagellar protein FlgJ
MSNPIDTTTSKSYMDFSGLGELRGKAQQNQDKALKESAQQFEGLFIQMMMKSMRDANAPMKDEENQSQAMETFEGMFDKEVSLQMSKRGAMGVGEFMERAVKQQMSAPPSTDTLLKARGKSVPLNTKQAPIALPSAADLVKGMKLDQPLRIKSLKELNLPFSGSVK